MEISMTINGTIKISMTPKTEIMKHLAELIKDGAIFEVTKPNNTADIVFTLKSDVK